MGNPELSNSKHQEGEIVWEPWKPDSEGVPEWPSRADIRIINLDTPESLEQVERVLYGETPYRAYSIGPITVYLTDAHCQNFTFVQKDPEEPFFGLDGFFILNPQNLDLQIDSTGYLDPDKNHKALELVRSALETALPHILPDLADKDKVKQVGVDVRSLYPAYITPPSNHETNIHAKNRWYDSVRNVFQAVTGLLSGTKKEVELNYLGFCMYVEFH